VSCVFLGPISCVCLGPVCCVFLGHVSCVFLGLVFFLVLFLVFVMVLGLGSCVCLGLVCHMLPVSLDCPFSIASSIFYNVYKLKKEKKNWTISNCLRSYFFANETSINQEL
jgi:hypothetical protein